MKRRLPLAICFFFLLSGSFLKAQPNLPPCLVETEKSVDLYNDEEVSVFESFQYVRSKLQGRTPYQVFWKVRMRAFPGNKMIDYLVSANLPRCQSVVKLVSISEPPENAHKDKFGSPEDSPEIICVKIKVGADSHQKRFCYMSSSF